LNVCIDRGQFNDTNIICYVHVFNVKQQENAKVEIFNFGCAINSGDSWWVAIKYKLKKWNILVFFKFAIFSDILPDIFIKFLFQTIADIFTGMIFAILMETSSLIRLIWRFSPVSRF